MSSFVFDISKVLDSTFTNTSCSVSSIVRDADNNIYVAGYFAGSVDFGNGAIGTNGAYSSGFIVKYKGSDLSYIDIVLITGNGVLDGSYPSYIVLDNTGTLYLTGNFGGNVDFGAGLVGTGGAFRASYIAKYKSSDLSYLDSVVFGGNNFNSNAFGVGLKLDNNNNIYNTGTFKGTIQFSSGSLTTPANTSTYLVKFDRNNLLTVIIGIQIYGNSSNDNTYVNDITIDENSIYLGGFFNGTTDFGGGLVNTGIGFNSSYLVKYNHSLIYSTVFVQDSSTVGGNVVIESIALDDTGNIYTTGNFNNSVNFGGGIITTNSNYAGYIGKYISNDFSYVNSTIFDGSDNSCSSNGNSIIFNNNYLYICGFFTNNIDFGNGVITTTSDQSAYLVKYKSVDLTYSDVILISGTINTDTAYGISALVNNNDIYILDTFDGGLNLDGTTITTIVSQAGLILKYSFVPPTTTTSTSTTTTTTLPITTTTTTHYEPICLPAGTPILTDQGLVAIENINISNNTIDGQKIIAITKTITPEKELICFEKYSLGLNIPNKRTVMTPGHQIYYKGNLIQAKHFVGRLGGVFTIPYIGDVLYNVLLKNHSLMKVNNMILETLHPENRVAKKILNNL